MHHPLSLTPVRFFCYRKLFDAQEPRIVHKISPTNQNNKSYSEFTPLKTNNMEPKQSRPLGKGTTSTNHQFFGFHVSFAGHLSSKRVTFFFGTSIAQCISITPSSVAFGNPDFGARKGLRCFKAMGKCGVLSAGLHYWKATCSFYLSVFSSSTIILVLVRCFQLQKIIMSQIGNHFPTAQGKNKKILPWKTKMSAETQCRKMYFLVSFWRDMFVFAGCS